MPTNAIYSEHIHSSLYLVSVQAKHNGIVEKEIVTEVPNDLLTVFAHQWQYMNVQKIAAYPAMYSNDKLGQAQQPKQPIFKQRKNRQHERAYIALCEETTTTCSATGISYIVRLPAAQHTNLETLHPLAHAQNVKELIEQCMKHGVHLHTRYERQVLAGMLLTLLRSKGLLRCKEPVRANLFLQHCRGNILSTAIYYLHGLHAVHGLPGLSLLNVNHLELSIKLQNPELDSPNAAKTAAELQILNWIHDCELVRESVKRTEEAQRKPKQAIKVYTDKVKQEAKTSKGLKATMRKAYEAIKASYAGNPTPLLALDFTIKTIEFLDAAKRKKVAQQIKERWQGEHGAAIADAILAMDTSATVAELGSLTDDLGHNGHDTLDANKGARGGKVDLMAMLAAKQQQKSEKPV